MLRAGRTTNYLISLDRLSVRGEFSNYEGSFHLV
jgi:hypothetical protein